MTRISCDLFLIISNHQSFMKIKPLFSLTSICDKPHLFFPLKIKHNIFHFFLNFTYPCTSEPLFDRINITVHFFKNQMTFLKQDLYFSTRQFVAFITSDENFDKLTEFFAVDTLYLMMKCP